MRAMQKQVKRALVLTPAMAPMLRKSIKYVRSIYFYTILASVPQASQSPEELERLNLKVEEVNKSRMAGGSMPGGMKKRSIQRMTHKEDAMRSVAKRLVEGSQGGDDATTCTDVALWNDACSSRDLVPMTGALTSSGSSCLHDRKIRLRKMRPSMLKRL